MLVGLLWNHWSFLVLFSIIHFGCWWEYFKLMEKIPAQKVELAKVADRVKQGLKLQEMQKLQPDYIVKLHKEADVEILDEKLKPTESKEGNAPALTPSPGAKP